MSEDGERPAEPRAIDVVASGELDSETVDRLIRFFGAPAAPSAPTAEEDPEVRALREVRARACEAVEPRLLARLESQKARTEALRTLPPPPPLRLDGDGARLAHFDFAAWGLRLAFEEREYDIPHALREALEQRAPQAILRDLHRPERSFDHVAYELHDTGVDVGGTRHSRDVRELMAQRFRADPAERRTAAALMADDLGELDRRLHEPWRSPHPRDDD